MATLHITVPDEVKARFEQAFSGQSLDELFTRFMREAVEQKPILQNIQNRASSLVSENTLVREAARKRLDALRGTVIVGDILAPLDEEWTGDADHL